MAGLLDIVPLGQTVLVRGVSMDVKGVQIRGIASLMVRFPEIRGLMSGQTLEPETLAALGGDVVSAIIAAGCGYPGDKAAEQAVDNLTLDEQLEILAAIIKLTMPQGLGPFAERLQALGLTAPTASKGGGGKTPTKSPAR